MMSGWRRSLAAFTTIALPLVLSMVVGRHARASPGVAQDIIAASAGYNAVYVVFKRPTGTAPILQYYVYAYQGGQRKLTAEIYPDNDVPRSSEFAIMKPLPSGTYDFTVKARDASGYGPESSPVSATTTALPREPMNLYVDPSLPNAITDGSYKPVATLSAGHGFKSIQTAVFAMNPGDSIYIKGGRYTERYSSDVAVHTHHLKNGTTAKYSSIQSYPGEWAIIDAQGQSKAVMGTAPGNSTSVFPGYWRIERIELTGGRGIGFFGNLGPFVIRHCYIHDNLREVFDGSNVAGLNGYYWHDSVVEYNHLKDNGYANDARGVAGMFIFGDYGHQYGVDVDHPLIINNSMRRNTIRYNLIEATIGTNHGDKGIATKGTQYLTSHTSINWDHKTMGDDIHHNIFRNLRHPIDQIQDFAQVHHNIAYASGSVLPSGAIDLAIFGVPSNDNYEITAAVLYNNTIIHGIMTRTFVAPHPAWNDPDVVPNPIIYHYNNIVAMAPYFDNGYPISIGYPYASGANPTYDSSRTDIRNNYAYGTSVDWRGKVAHVRVNHSGMGACFGALTFSEYTACTGQTNYANDVPDAGDPLFAPGGIKTRGQHRVSASATIEDGGIGGSHPYLFDVTLPSHVGAANPNDNAWIDGVLALETVGTLLSGSSGAEPWTEGYSAPTDLSPPTAPTNLVGVAVSVTSVILTWSASTDAVGVAGYHIYRDGMHIGTSQTALYTDGDVAAATGYLYAVAAFDAAGNVSSRCSTTSITTPDYELPGTPQDVIAVPAGTDRIHVLFRRPAGTDPISMYYVYAYQNGRRESSGEVYTDPLTNRSLEFIEMRSLAAGTYQFRVAARNPRGLGPESAAVEAATLPSPRGPMNIYVDPSLPSAIVDGSHRPVPSLQAGHGFKSIQAAIFAMNPGDDIYIKGGRYVERYSSDVAVFTHHLKNGTPSRYSSMQSYPGEWAIIDAQGRSDVAVGVPSGYSPSAISTYWRIERLELTGGRGIGFYGNQGPFVIRYCFIHDNLREVFDGSNVAGINGYVWHDSVVEYNFLKDNGYTNGRQGVTGAFIFGDYGYQYGLDADHPVNADYCMQRNTIRYNLIEKTHNRPCGDIGAGTKSNQYLTPHNAINWNHKHLGDEIHHNIFRNFSYPLNYTQDFAQVHNNIFVVPDDIKVAVVGVTGNEYREVTGAVVYNNTIINGVLASSFVAPSTANHDPAVVLNPYIYFYNNLVAEAPNLNSNYPIGIGFPYPAQANPSYSAARTDIRSNYAYRTAPDSDGSVAHVRINHSGMGSCFGALTFFEYEGCTGQTNFANETPDNSDPLFEPGSFVTRAQHRLSGTASIANGGIGEAHPYLEGVSIPSYIGAANPTDSSWVEGVQNLGVLDSGNVPVDLRLAINGSTPSWVEAGSIPPSQTLRPARPHGLRVK